MECMLNNSVYSSCTLNATDSSMRTLSNFDSTYVDTSLLLKLFVFDENT